MSNDALATVRELGSVDELRALAQRGFGPSIRPKSNTHIHLPPNFSAFESVKQAVDLADKEGIDALGATNYYDFGVYAEFVARTQEAGIFPLFGTEIICLIDDLVRAGVRINDPGNPGKMYICAKGITRFENPTAKAHEILGTIRGNDQRRMAEMIGRLEKLFADADVATGLDEQKVIGMVVRRHGSSPEHVTLQERHVAQAFQEAFFAKVPAGARQAKLTEIFGSPAKSGPEDSVKVQGEIRSQLMKAGKPAFVAESFVDFDQARTLILELGGIPCYPTLADGVTPICEYEDPVAKLIDNIRQHGIHCAEFVPIRNEPTMLEKYVAPMRQAGLVITAGTEHNTLDLLPIEPQCVKGQPVPETIEEIFWEGTCVVAAHQFLLTHDQTGFVDETGRPNRDYPTAEERIAAFAALGRAVIGKYLDKFKG
ncbi:MAG: hypothetical protein GXY33_13880 [Phycisphaerae bacterium]|nr:hypothetical protein [Phycisphaerae bacterium]